MTLILFFILILNVIAIVLTYYCLSNLEKKERTIFIAVGVAVIYILTSFVYWLSTKDIVIKEVSELGRNLLTFLFVPINALLTLPILAKSYNKYKIGSLASEHLRNRGIVLIILLCIILLIECSYFKEIQNGVITLIEENNQKKVQIIQNESNTILNNEIENEITNQIVNDTNNIIDSTNIINGIDET